MERQAYESMAGIEGEHWWFVGRRAILKSLIERKVKLPPAPSILEAGCGSGGNLELLKSFGELDAFEFDKTARQIASDRSGLEVTYGRLPDGIDHLKNEYDLIALFDVLEHLDDDLSSMKALSARLGENGSLVVTVPAIPALWSSHDEVHHHKRRYSRKSLLEVLENAGLSVDYITHFNSLLLPAAVVQRLLSRLSDGQTELDGMPLASVNSVLKSIFSFERHLLLASTLPLGLSLFAKCSQK